VATAAGLATLKACTPEVYTAVEANATTVREAASAALTAAGVPHLVNTAGSMFSVFFTGRDSVTNYEEARQQDLGAFRAFFHSMLDQGIHLPPSAFEAWFLSAGHDETAIGRIVEALPVAARAAAEGAGGL